MDGNVKWWQVIFLIGLFIAFQVLYRPKVQAPVFRGGPVNKPIEEDEKKKV